MKALEVINDTYRWAITQGISLDENLELLAISLAIEYSTVNEN